MDFLFALLSACVVLAFIYHIGRHVLRLFYRFTKSLHGAYPRPLFHFDLMTGLALMIVASLAVGSVVWLVRERNAPLGSTVLAIAISTIAGITLLLIGKWFLKGWVPGEIVRPFSSPSEALGGPQDLANGAMATIPREQIVGQRIVAVHLEIHTKDGDDFDFITTYFTLDNRVSFVLPMSYNQVFSTCEVPSHIRPIKIDDYPRLVSGIIDGVYRDLYEGKGSSEVVLLHLSSGVWVTSVLGAPLGVGGAGLFIYGESEVEWESVKDFWADL